MFKRRREIRGTLWYTATVNRSSGIRRPIWWYDLDVFDNLNASYYICIYYKVDCTAEHSKYGNLLNWRGRAIKKRKNARMIYIRECVSERRKLEV